MTVLWAILHIFAFDLAYRFSIHPLFEYAAYTLNPATTGEQLLTYVVALAPIVCYRPSPAPSSLGASLIYGLAYVPATIMLLHMWQRAPLELIILQATLAGSMAALFLVAHRGYRGGENLGEKLHVPMQIVTTVVVCVVAFVYREHLRIVSFADVYELRAESSEVGRGSIVGYLALWLTYALMPFHFVQWLHRRRQLDLILALVASLVIYMGTGSKAALLTPAIMLVLSRVLRAGPDVLRSLLARLSIVQAAILLLIPDDGILFWMKSILFVRVLGTSGWTIATYYEYFTSRQFTHYTHIGPVNAITDAYPYQENSLGQLIGQEYSANPSTNFNAGFWASDGIAALGVAGIPIITLAVAIVLFAVNRFTSGYSPRFVGIWLIGFWLAVLNVPLTTALLSGGGGLILALLWIAQSGLRRQRQVNPSGRVDPTATGTVA